MRHNEILDRFASRFEELIKEGESVVARCWRDEEWLKSPGASTYVQFRTEALNLVRRACGADSDHYRELQRLATTKDSASNDFYFRHCLGALKASYRDFSGGYLADLRTLVAAEILDDFMDQAEHLLAHGYHAPSASLAGAVLEDSLRKLCARKEISLPDKTSIDRMNAELAKVGMYNKLTQKRITALADIRNSADHGRFDEFTADDVSDMVKWIRRFTADFLE